MRGHLRLRSLALGLALPLLVWSCGGERKPEMKLAAHLEAQALDAEVETCAGNWGYKAPDGRRLALTGTSAGLSIVDVTRPEQPRKLGFVAGAQSLWREIKTYRNYVYVTTEADYGLDIIDLRNPEQPRKVRTWNRSFTSAHSLWIDAERGLLFANGTRDATRQQTGLRVLDLKADPEDPTDLGGFKNYYIHDSYNRGNRLYAAAIASGFAAILDVSNPANIREINRWFTGGHFTHNSWLTEDGRYLFTTDEVSRRPLEGWDIADPMNPVKVSEYIGKPSSLPHNVLIDGDRLLVAHYDEGVHLVDISDPTRPSRLASYDTFIGEVCPDLKNDFVQCHGECGEATPFCGVWGAYIFPGTGHIVASDIHGGLYVLEYTE